jgi:hypothetical protein
LRGVHDDPAHPNLWVEPGRRAGAARRVATRPEDEHTSAEAETEARSVEDGWGGLCPF